MGASKGPCPSVGVDPEGVKHNRYGANDGQHGHYCGCGLVWGADGRARSRESEKIITVYADATAGALQTIAAEVLGYQPGVSGGRYATVDLAAFDAQRVVKELRARGYEAWAD